MNLLLLFLLASYGLTNIVIDSKAGEIIRPILAWIPIVGKSTDCYACFGVYSGIACSPILFWNHWIPLFLGGGLAASAVCPMLAWLKAWLDEEYQLRQLRR